MRIILTAIPFAALIAVSTLMAQNSQSDQKAIKQLEARLKALEARVATLEQTKETKYITVPSPQPPPATTPDPRWKPFEFNGQTYYAIPLRQAETNTM